MPSYLSLLCFMVLSPALNAFVDGRVFPRSADLLHRQIEDSPCQPQCSPENCGGSSCSLRFKRNLEPFAGLLNQSSVAESDHRTLAARKLSKDDTEPDKLGAYLDSHNLQNTAAEGLCDGSAASLSFCTQRTFFDLPSDRASYIGTKQTELIGCTVLAVVSARGVYMCHFYETLAFAQNFNGGPPPDFQGNVINLIHGQSPTYQAFGPALDVNLFNRERDATFAFISTPRVWGEQGDVKTPMFQNAINNLVTTIRQLIPGVVVMVRPYEKPWLPDAAGLNQYPQDQPWRGQALFEFDPLADGRYGADWRLWFEQASERGRQLGQLVG